jgi:RNA polymerase sigma factor (sigma-70 family)
VSIKRTVKQLLVSVLRQKGILSLADIYRYIQLKRKNVHKAHIRGVLNVDVLTEFPIFKRVDEGVYCLAAAKTSQKILKPVKRSDKSVNKDEFRVEDHLGYLNSKAVRLANEFYKDPEDIFSEIILVAYDNKHRYDPRKGKPTTFILREILPRLRNKITREIIPNVFKMTEVESPNGEIKKKGVRAFIPMVSLSEPVLDGAEVVELIDQLDATTVGGKIREYGSRPDVEYENADFKRKIMQYFLSAGAREKDVIMVTKRYGLESGRQMTLEEVGSEEGITKEGVRQAIKRVFNTLKKKNNIKELKKMIA